MNRILAGTRVVKSMGVQQSGTVLAHSVPRERWTDGTYRYPEKHEKPVWVRWDDGSEGWSHYNHLTKESEHVHPS